MNDDSNQGSNGNIVPLLERIALANEATNERLDDTNRRLDRGFAQLDAKLDETNDKTNKRLDNMIGFLSAHHGDHEDRIKALEEAVFPKPKG